MLALLAYLASVGAAIWTLLPHKLETEFRGSSLLRVSRDADATDDEAYEAVVMSLETIRDKNAAMLGKLTAWYVVAAVALGVEVLLWSLALTT